jgi:hypothetical protein
MLKAMSGGLDTRPRGVAAGFFGPDGQMFVGSSFCSDKDHWNRHMGLWSALCHAWSIPKGASSVIGSSAVPGEVRKLLGLGLNNREPRSVLPAPWSVIAHELQCCDHKLMRIPIPKRRHNGRMVEFCPTCGKPLWRLQFPPSTREAVLHVIGMAARRMKSQEEKNVEQPTTV